MKIVEFDDKENPRPAGRERRLENGDFDRGGVKVREFGAGGATSAPGSPNIDVGRIKIREFSDEPSRRGPSSSTSAAVTASNLNKPPAFRMPDRASIKIVEFGDEKGTSRNKPSAEPPRGMRIIESER